MSGAVSGACLSDEQIAALVDRSASGAARASANEHVDRCAACRLLVGAAVRAAPPSAERPIAGRYEVLALVGSGAMGSVYRVRDVELDEVVALKFRRREQEEAPQERERFRREVKLARRVTHRNVARTYDIGEFDGEMFLTMEFIEGDSLANLLSERGPLPLRQAVEVGLELCAGLTAAHAAGVIHRDLKPANVMLEAASGRVVIADFGLARALDVQGTIAGGLSGTPAYMAPEQIAGLPDIDQRVDVYALGRILQELLAGERTARDSELAGRVPDALADLLRRCLAARREERPSQVAEVAVALKALALDDAADLAPAPAYRPVDGAATTVAVLPFEYAGPPGDAYICEELVEDLVESLSAARRVRVPPSSVVRRAHAGGADPREIGRRLGVAAIVEGSLRRTGDTMRIAARLISVDEGFQLWSRRLVCSARELLTVNDEIARGVLEALHRERAHPTRPPAPHTGVAELHLKARRALREGWRGFPVESLVSSVTLFEQALVEAPDDPGLLAGYATARAKLYNYMPSLDGAAAVRALARRAIDAGPHLAEAWLALGTIEWVTSDWAGACLALRRTLARAPGHIRAMQMLGSVQIEVGALDEGMQLLERALFLDPSAESPRLDLARACAFRGQWGRVRELLAVPPGTEPSIALGAAALRIATWCRDVPYVLPRGGWGNLPGLGDLVELALDARADRPLDVQRLQRLEKTAEAQVQGLRLRPLLWQGITELGAFRHDREWTIRALPRCVDAQLFDLVWLDRCPLLEPYRDDPEFRAQRARVAERVEPIVAALSSPL